MKAILEHIVTRLSPFYGPQEARELAFWIIEETTGMNRFDVSMHKGTKNIPELEIILKKLSEYVPVQYIFGHTEWLGLDLKVTPATLIPRPETAELVTLICNQHSLPFREGQGVGFSTLNSPYGEADRSTIGRKEHSTLPSFQGGAGGRLLNILDLGTGSGCIAMALKQRHPEWQVAGLDNSREALSIARNNAARNNLDVHFFYADILTDDIGHYDLIVSNPPYIRPSERDSMTANTLLHEPAQALFVPENDPLIFYRRIAELHAADELWFEINEHLGNEMITRMQQSGYEAQCLTDSYGKQRFIHAQFSR